MLRGFFKGFERPPIWATISIIVGVVVLAVLMPIASHRRESPASAETAPAQATEDAGVELVQEQDASATDADAPLVLVVGDSYTSGSAQGGKGSAGWGRLVAKRLQDQGTSARFTFAAAGGAGYVATGPAGLTFGQLLEANVSADDDLIVFFGSRNDGRNGTEDAATQAYAAAKAAAPNAQLLVIGPPWVDDNPPSNILGDRDAVKAAAEAAGARFVDPIADSWFGGENAKLIGADDVHPTNEGHAHMADLITPLIQEAIRR